MKKAILMTVFLVLILSVMDLGAEERFGMEVYTGAEYEESASEFLQESGANAFCYRTGDKMAAVIDFYKGKEGLYLISEDDSSAFFRRCAGEEYNKIFDRMMPKDCDLDITVQSPWMNMKTEKINNDTLISFTER
jgi:hypothetical protein